MNNVQVRLLRWAVGKNAGSIVSVTDHVAEQLVAKGWAEYCRPQAAAANPVTVQTKIAKATNKKAPKAEPEEDDDLSGFDDEDE